MTFRRLTILFILLNFLFPIPAGGAVSVTLQGNQVYSNGELEALFPQQNTPYSCATLKRAISRSMYQFYRKNGYSLVHINAYCRSDMLTIEIDEGKLDKILFFGADTLKIVIFKLRLNLPRNVFHKPTLSQSLKQIKKEYHLTRITYKIVKVKMEGIDQPIHQLHIHVSASRGLGIGFGITTDSQFGFVPFVGYTDEDLLLKGDLFRISTELGFYLRKRITDGEYYPLWTHSALLIQYDFPKLIKQIFQPTVDAYLDVSNFQRPDLPLEKYHMLKVGAVFLLQMHPTESLTIGMGAGIEDRKLFKITEVPTEPAHISPFNRLRGLIMASADYDFNPSEIRLDHLSMIRLEFFHSFQRGLPGFQSLLLKSCAYLPFGYHELEIKGRGIALFGHPDFYDLHPLGGEFLRVFFGGRYYVREAVQLSLEWRFGLYKDIVKLSLFNDFSIFGKREEGKRTVARVANASGTGFHLLILDLIQFNLYYGFGFAPSGFSHNLYFIMAKVF